MTFTNDKYWFEFCAWVEGVGELLARRPMGGPYDAKLTVPT
jgi:hypothetical protein